MQNFNGKVAVITGGASGVGRALAVQFGEAGCKLVIADIEQGALETTVAQLRDAGFDAIGQVTDVAKPEALERLAERSFSHFGAVHLVFNNAGVGGGGGATLWDTSPKAWTWGFSVNFWGVVNGISAFMPRLIKQNEEAHIINTASGVGLVYPPSSGVYSITKAAVISTTEILHNQLTMQKLPIKAHILFPGPYVVETNLFSSGRNRPAELTEDKPSSNGVNSLEDMQAIMEKTIGRRIDTSTPESVAEYAIGALRRDEFWILPMHERLKFAIRERTEGMLALRNPTIPDVM